MIDYIVPGMTLIPQEDNMSCWYASARMLIQWKMDKYQVCFADLVPPELDTQCVQIRDAQTGLLNNQILKMAKRLGLEAVPPVSPSPEAISRWLKSYGPLWVNGKSHIVVIAGVTATQVLVYDPWPPKKGKIDWRSLEEWYVGSSASSRDTGRDVEAVFLYCP